MSKADVVNEFVKDLMELAFTYAEAHLDGDKLANFLEDIVDKGNHSYELHTGEPLNTDLVEAEDAL
jgi:hypothetical protein